MNTRALIQGDVVRAITRALRSFGVRRGDMEDGIAEVQTRALEYLRGRPHPADVEQWIGLCVTVAKHWRLDEKAKAATQKKYSVGLCEDADEHVGFERPFEAPDTVDAARQVRVLQQQFDDGEMPDKGDEILDCVQAGLDYQQTSAELGITPEAVRKRLKRMRKLFAERLEPQAEPPSAGRRRRVVRDEGRIVPPDGIAVRRRPRGG